MMFKSCNRKLIWEISWKAEREEKHHTIHIFNSQITSPPWQQIHFVSQQYILSQHIFNDFFVAQVIFIEMF